MSIDLENPRNNVEATYSASEETSAQNSEMFDYDLRRKVPIKRVDPLQLTDKVFYDETWAIPYSERKCCVCPGNGRLAIPRSAIESFWLATGIWMPLKNRCCVEHLKDGVFTEESVILLRSRAKCGVWLKTSEIQSWIQDLTANTAMRSNYFDVDSPNMAESDYLLLFGITKENFEDLFLSIKDNLRYSIHRSPKNALAICLMKLRLDISQQLIGHMFGIPQRKVSQTISRVAKLLDEKFVPLNYGYTHKSRSELLESHDSEFARRLLNVPAGSVILVLDGTYLYTQKPGDSAMQKNTWSMQKGRNLLKVMIVVTATGYILDAFGKL